MNRRRFIVSAGLAAAGAYAAAERAEAEEVPIEEGERRPNVIWIWCDNLAYRDLEAYGNDQALTPVTTRMAREGVRFTQYYIAHTVCSPSRAALLTGRQPFRTGIVDVLRPDSPIGLPEEEITLGHAFRNEGYATAAFGKWHLGDKPAYLPLQRGFDYYYGLPYSMDMLPTLLYRNNEVVEELPGDSVRDVTERLVDDAIQFIAGNVDRPFFVYFSHTIPHPPLNIPPEQRRTGRTVYDDAVSYMDEQTGRILDALRELGLDDNTLVLFSSDNGPMGEFGNTGELRGRIRDAYEGGVRVPLIARWPGKIPAGLTVNEPAIAYDIFPTVLGAAGAQPPADRSYDGMNIMPLLTGAGDVTREEPFYWVYLDNVTAMRWGRWKLHVGERDKALEAPELYDVEGDPGESVDLGRREPEVVARLLKMLREFEKQIPYVWSLNYTVRDPRKRDGGVRTE